jgi:hypothetical protein
MLRGISATAFSSAGVVTAAGTTQGTATPITTRYAVVVVDTGATGAILPAAKAGMTIKLLAVGGGANIYPATGNEIFGLSAVGVNTPAQMADETAAQFDSMSDGFWYATALGA